jgi:hypothetical protein
VVSQLPPAEPAGLGAPVRSGNVVRGRRPDGTPVAVKSYPRADTAAYKCWGSGVANERLVAPLLPGVRVPHTYRVWVEGGAEHAELAWLPGTRPAVPLDAAALRRAGRLLGRVHGCRGGWWGSLDGRYRFETAAGAFADRFAAAVRLLARGHPELATAVRRWAGPRLGALRLTGPPRLVHGDFGPANLVTGATLGLLDWEHARWGHPQEDWAKIRLAADFPEPNGFGPRPAVDAVAAGWRAATGGPPPDDPEAELLMRLYCAVCLGVFFAPLDLDRLAWVARVVGGRVG